HRAEPIPTPWVLPGILARGVVTVLCAPPGLGKSTLAHHFASLLTKGESLPAPFPELTALDRAPHPDLPRAIHRPNPEADANDPTLVLRPPCETTSLHRAPTWPTDLAPGFDIRARTPVLLLSKQDDLRTTIVPRLRAHGADPDHLAFASHFMADNGTTSHDLQPGTLFAHITENLKGTVGLQALIIDDLEAWLPFSTKDRPKVRQFLNELHTTAKHFQIAILLITHTAEGGRKHAIRPAGAELLLSAPRLAYTILPAPTDTDPTRRCLRRLKSNIPIPTPHRLFYSLNSDQSLTWDAAPVPQPNSIKTPAGLYLHQPYCVHGQAEAEAADRAHRHQQWTEVRAARIAHKAANPPPPRPCPMVNESMRLLTERLRREPLPASELLNLCSAHRISPKTTYIAKDKLRITAETVTPTQATTPAATPSDLSTHTPPSKIRTKRSSHRSTRTPTSPLDPTSGVTMWSLPPDFKAT
ncbi:MAG: AAA family ATPase, partial [bacterium]